MQDRNNRRERNNVQEQNNNGEGREVGGQNDEQQHESEAVAQLVDTEYVDPHAILGRPKTLLMLWHEYLFGLGSNKPAKDFTPTERGRQKHKYCRRKCFWSVMARLNRAGYDELSAIDLIHEAYGANQSVTNIIKALQKGKNNGYHPTLAAVIGNDN